MQQKRGFATPMRMMHPQEVVPQLVASDDGPVGVRQPQAEPQWTCTSVQSSSGKALTIAKRSPMGYAHPDATATRDVEQATRVLG